jgi:hypothetical protein
LRHVFSIQGRLCTSREYDKKFSIPQHTLSIKNGAKQPQEESVNSAVIIDASRQRLTWVEVTLKVPSIRREIIIRGRIRVHITLGWLKSRIGYLQRMVGETFWANIFRSLCSGSVP